MLLSTYHEQHSMISMTLRQGTGQAHTCIAQLIVCGSSAKNPTNMDVVICAAGGTGRLLDMHSQRSPAKQD